MIENAFQNTNIKFQTGPLACAYCGRGFNDFGPLAEHVRTECGPDRSNTMKAAPNPSGKAGSSSRLTSAPDPEAGERNPFIKPEDLGRSGSATIEILGLEEFDSDFSDIACPVRLGRKEFVMPMRLSSGNYIRLHKRFGSNPKKWRGKVRVEVKNYMKKDYVAVSD
jgi:hypothetical protein